MISQSWDGKRLYITSSLLANWDKGGADNEQFIRGFAWDGSELTRKFEVDFTKEKLGRAHHMKLGTKAQRATVTGGFRAPRRPPRWLPPPRWRTPSSSFRRCHSSR